ncbi:MAG: T9SS type A sorting domain-containing protein [Ignavibacteria bacterium]|nr:T9SS type A sorting domain-containing protein [Ignavibacteria bacterium]
MRSYIVAMAILYCCFHLTTTRVVAQWVVLPINQTNKLSASSFLNKDIGFVAAGREILRTVDGGLRWTSVPVSNSVWSISAAKHSLVAFAVGEAIYRTINAGETWDSIYKQNENGPFGSTVDVSFSSTTYGCILGSVLEFTTNGGASWNIGEAVPLPFSDPLSVFVLSERIAYAGGFFSEYMVGALMKTTDGGATWRHIINHLPPFGGAPNGVRAIHFFNESVGIIAGPLDPPQSPNFSWRPHVLRTIDGGQTWQMPEFKFWHDVNTIAFADSLRGFIGDAAGNIYSTTDGGITWKNDNVPSSGRSINSICVAGGSRVFAVGDSGLILRFDLPVSVDEHSIAASPLPTLRLLPNPATGSVRVETGGAEIATVNVVDILGKVLDVPRSGATLDTSMLPAGMYVVMARVNNAVKSAMLMICNP